MHWSLCALVVVLTTACGATRDTDPAGAPLLDSSTAGDPDTSTPELETSFDACTTTISGTVWNPAQTDPLYNVVVYLPSKAIEPFRQGVACEKCGAVSGEPIAATLSDANGKFTLTNVAPGAGIPLVVQVGRWRRQVTIPKVLPCVDNVLPAELTRLPKSRREGDIPRTAIVTSTYDPTECVLKKLGVEESEFGPGAGDERIHLFRGTGQHLGTETPRGDVLYGNLARLKEYDVVAFPCSTLPIDSTHKQNVVEYANAGGRVLVTDLSHPWVDDTAAPAWSAVAKWGEAAVTNPFTIATDFPKGKALADWLKGMGATPTYAEIALEGAYARVASVNSNARSWIGKDGNIQHFTFNTPVDAKGDAQCGRVVYSSFHVALPGGNDRFPSGCSPYPLTPQEKVLEFMLFDLASCIQIDSAPPKPPK